MSPTLTRRKFGSYTLVQLGSERSYVSFVPERSAYVHQICLDGHQLLWNYESAEALTEHKKYKNLSLVPFPNRILEGEYTWGDRILKFPVTDPETQSALHGFGAKARFALQDVEVNERFIEATLVYEHAPKKHAPSYPFAVRFTCKLCINTTDHQARWQLMGENLEQSASVPIGLGWHPYYLLPGGPSAWSICLPPTEQILTTRAIPTGQTAPGPESLAAGVAIDTGWDDCFQLTGEANRRVELLGPGYGLSLQPSGDVRFLQLFVPPTRNALAVEPMSCGIDAFRQNPASVSVAPGERIEIGMDIGLLRGRSA